MQLRYGTAIVVALAWLVVGATCLPLVDLDPPESGLEERTELAVSIVTPSEDREVAEGAVIEIEWTAANTTGSAAVATIVVRPRDDFSAETILEGGLRLAGVGETRTLEWNTTGFRGAVYEVIARVVAGGQMEEAVSAGRITINTPPAFNFIEPIRNTKLIAQEDPNDQNAPEQDPEIKIRWAAVDSDGDGRARLGLVSIDPNEAGDLDDPSTLDEPNDLGEEEITIGEVEFPTIEGIDSLQWDGTDTSGQPVEAGDYHLYALVSDGLNAELLVGARQRDDPNDPNDPGTRLLRITVPEEPEQFELALTKPEEDETLLTSDPNDFVTIEYTLDEDEDVFIDLRIDTDDDDSNGNETTIVARRKVEEGTNEGSEDWKGKDAEGADVDRGIYRVFMVVSRGTGSPQRIAAEGLVFVRDEEELPLIELLQPADDLTFQSGEGGEIRIRWRDDDPSESAKIRLTIDDDATPNEDEDPNDPNDTLPEETIPSAVDLDPAGDGIEDTFIYYLKDTQPSGRFWIFAYIDRGDATEIDHISVAAGQVVIEAPDEGK